MNKTKRLLGLILVVFMLLAFVPLHALANDVDPADSVAPVAENGETVLPDGVTADSFGSNTVTDGTNYYANLTAALKAVYGVDNAVLYCKPGANVGQMTHGAVKASLTVYGNGAYTSGNGDFDIGNCNYQGKELASDMTLTVVSLNGCGAWGYKNTEHTVNLVFTNCKDMSEVYLSGTSGATNITMTGCEFTDNVDGGNCKVYSNANGTITIKNTLFNGVDKAINLNHKVDGTQTVTIEGCTFVDCGNDVAQDQIPVRVLSSVEGGVSVLTVSGCTFTGTPEGGADILLDYGVGKTTATIDGTAANVIVELENNVGTETAIAADETKTFANVKPVAQIGDVKYATLQDALNAGGEVVLLTDIVLTETATVPAGTSVTLDLNGKTISQSKECTASYEMISNKGNLTITGNGKISFTDTSAGDATHSWGSYTIRNEGTLVVENGTIEHNGAQAFAKHMICAIFQYSGSTTINSGTISTPSYRSVRLWKGEMTINGGTFDGQVWVQAVDNSANLAVNGGTFEPNGNDASSVFVSNADYDVEFVVTDGTFNGKIGVSNADKLAGAVTGGTFSAAAKNGTSVALLATGLSFGEANEDGYCELKQGLAGSGTEEDPFLINNIDDLKFFRDSVNNGTRYNGQFVKLNADIDLNDEEWTPIGDRNVDQGSFLGTFDGGNHTISNLWISEWTKTGAGFFSKVGLQSEYVSGTVKNLIFKNITIISNQSYVGVIAQAPSGALIDNVHVIGDITISGYGYVGGIVGHGYPTINNCSVIGNSPEDKGTITANYWGAGAILGFSGDYGSKVNNATVKNVEIHGNYGGAASVTGSPYGAAVNGANVSDVTITSNSDYCMGYVAAGGTVNNATISNVTATASGAPITPADAVAAIGENVYFTLADAVAAAKAGDVIVLLNDVTVDKTLEIAADKSFTLDLAGKTITAGWNDEAAGKHIYAITNRGTLVITGNGTINSRGIYNYGNLTLESGTINAIDANGGYGVQCLDGATFTMNGGAINTTNEDGDAPGNGYDATTVRVEEGATFIMYGGTINNISNFTVAIYNSGTTTIYDGTVTSVHTTVANYGTITINGGKFTCNGLEGVTAHAIWAASGTTTINGGTFDGKDNYNGFNVDASAGAVVDINGGNFLSVHSGSLYGDGTITVYGGTFFDDVAARCAEGYAAIKDLNGKYIVGEKPTATVNNMGSMVIPGGEYGVWNGSSYSGTSTENMPLSFVMQFLADQTAADMANSPYADWYADFVITFTGLENESFVADGCYLAGFYGDFGWVKVPVDGMTIENGVRYPVMLGVGLGQKYDYVCSGVQDFRCALYLTPEILAANPNIEVNLELAIVDNSNGSDAALGALMDGETTYKVVDYGYDAEDFAIYVAQIGDNKFTSIQAAIDAAQVGDVIVLLDDVTVDATLEIAADKSFTLDLAGYNITAGNDKVNLIINGKLTIDDTIGGGVSTFRNHMVYGELVLENGTIQNISTLEAGFAVLLYGGKFTLNDGTVQSVNTSNYAISSFEVDGNAEIVINGGIINGKRGCLAVECGTYAIVNGGEFNVTDAIGGHCVYVTDATIEINDGIFYPYPTNACSSYAVFAYNAAASVTINGGVFNASAPASNVYASAGAITIGGGEFALEPISTYLKEGYGAIKNLDGKYIVGVKPTAGVNANGPTTIPGGEYSIYDGSFKVTQEGDPDMPLSFVMQFLADQTAADIANSPYAKWYADFVITFTGIENGSFIADNCYLAGHYGSFGWVKVPVDGMKIEDGARYPVMLGVGLPISYEEVCTSVKDFKCALYLTPEILEANPNLKVNLELAVVENSDDVTESASALVNQTSGLTVNKHEYEAEDFVVNYVAQIGDNKFTSIQAAIDAANVGDTITLLADIELDASIKVAGNVTLDLAGYIITGTDNNTSGNFYLFDVTAGASFTVEDSVGEGAITLTATNERNWNASSVVIANNRGTVTVNGGRIEHFGGTSMAYALDNLTNGVNTVATMVVNGGTINSSYIAIRQFCNGTNAQNILNITGGTLTAGNTTVWMQNPNSNDNSGALNITGGTFNGRLLVGSSAVFAPAVSGGTFSVAVPEEYCADGYVPCDNGDGTYGVEKINLIEWGNASVTAGTNLDINFYLKNSSLDPNTKYYAKVIKIHTESCGDAPYIYYIPQSEWIPDEKGVYTAIVVKDISAKEMNCWIDVQIFAGEIPGEGEAEGAIASEEAWMSVSYYATTLLRTTKDANLKTLLVDMLNYGAEAQKHFEHDADNLANSALTDEEKELATSSVNLDNAYATPRDEYSYSASLTLKDTILLNFYFTNLNNAGEQCDYALFDAVITYTTHGATSATSYVINNATLGWTGKNTDKVAIKSLAAADVDTVVTCELRYDGEVISTISANIAYYCWYNIEYQTAEAAISEAMMKYGQSSLAYFNSKTISDNT